MGLPLTLTELGIRKNNYDLQGFEPQIILCRAAVLPTVPQPLLQESSKNRLYRGIIELTLTLPLTDFLKALTLTGGSRWDCH